MLFWPRLQTQKTMVSTCVVTVRVAKHLLVQRRVVGLKTKPILNTSATHAPGQQGGLNRMIMSSAIIAKWTSTLQMDARTLHARNASMSFATFAPASLRAFGPLSERRHRSEASLFAFNPTVPFEISEGTSFGLEIAHAIFDSPSRTHHHYHELKW